MTELIFPSRVDIWLIALMAGGTLLCALPIPKSFQRGALIGLLMVFTTACMAAGTWWIGSLEYAFVGDALEVRSLIGTEQLLQVSAVTDVRPTNDLRGAPASSLDRFAITWGDRGRVVLVSPDDRAGFLDAIAERAPGLVRDGERLYAP